MGSYWWNVAKRAFKEAATLLGFGSAERAVVTVALQATIALLIYLLLGTTELKAELRLITALAPLAVFPLLFLWKLIAVPAEIDREQHREEDQERRGHVFYLAALYVRNDVSSDKETNDLIHYGLALPPEEWLNAKLEELAFGWRVRVKPDAKFETYSAE